MGEKYSIVIPTFNEAENIITLLSAIEKIFERTKEDIELIVIDENSQDGTYDNVLHFSESRDFIRIEKNPGTPGLSSSIVYGFDIADGDYLCCMDGDLQHDEAMLPELFREARNGCDMVIGSRYVPGGGFTNRCDPIRKLGSQIITMMTRFVLNIKIADPMSGFFVIRKNTYKRVCEKLNPSGFKLMLELLYNLRFLDYEPKVKEVGILFRNRKYGESKMNTKVVWLVIKMLFDLRKSSKRYN